MVEDFEAVSVRGVLSGLWPNIACRLDASAQPKGGVRWWLLCPTCNRRRVKLHRPDAASEWRCRLCYDLGYLSRRLDQVASLQRQAERLLGYLAMRAIFRGAAKGAGGPDYPRPKRMRRLTYRRLLGRAEDYEDRALNLVLGRIRRLYETSVAKNPGEIHETS